jgi:GNAT superfamily N-acetyltransferase
MVQKVDIRRVMPADADVLLAMIHRLAIANDAEATITVQQLLDDGFGNRRWFHALIAESDGEPAAYALWHFAYNANYGTRFLQLQHLYVEARRRRMGIGRRLIAAVAREALDQGCVGLVLGVVAGNDDAIAFYRALGFARDDPQDPRFFLDHEGMIGITS